MSGRFEVSLHKVGPCRRCGAPKTARTHPVAGTVIDTTCSPYRCPIARTLHLTAGPRPASFEPLAVDDRRTPKTR